MFSTELHLGGRKQKWQRTLGIPRRWAVADSAEMYAVRAWGGGYFAINDAGNVSVTPDGPDLVADRHEGARRRGASRAASSCRCSSASPTSSRTASSSSTKRSAAPSTEYGYKGSYKGVYPIKVNQDRYVVEEIIEYGRPYHYGLEAGSQAGAARRHGDARGRRRAHHLQRLQGRGVHRDRAARVEARAAPSSSSSRSRPSSSSSPHLASASAIKPRIGMRAKLSSRGSGRWEASGGDSLEVRPDRRARWSRRSSYLKARTSCSTRSSCCTSTSARRSRAIRSRQERAARGRALLRRAAQDGRAAQVPRRRRRSRRRLRRLADQLRSRR